MSDRALTPSQLQALTRVAQVGVRVDWGDLPDRESGVSWNTLWSLMDRGLVATQRRPGVCRLTAFGKQVLGWASSSERGSDG